MIGYRRTILASLTLISAVGWLIAAPANAESERINEITLRNSNQSRERSGEEVFPEDLSDIEVSGTAIQSSPSVKVPLDLFSQARAAVRDSVIQGRRVRRVDRTDIYDTYDIYGNDLGIVQVSYQFIENSENLFRSRRRCTSSSIIEASESLHAAIQTTLASRDNAIALNEYLENQPIGRYQCGALHRYRAKVAQN